MMGSVVLTFVAGALAAGAPEVEVFNIGLFPFRHDREELVVCGGELRIMDQKLTFRRQDGEVVTQDTQMVLFRKGAVEAGLAIDRSATFRPLPGKICFAGWVTRRDGLTTKEAQDRGAFHVITDVAFDMSYHLSGSPTAEQNGAASVNRP